ncbi:MAG: hypothetical protein ACOX1V_00765 [Candidatus Iainarchaeum sp.]|jgi:hypothetical protein|nr:MAG: hypothetical protein BWY55_00510 [archaeon ADurb.Bin336]
MSKKKYLFVTEAPSVVQNKNKLLDVGEVCLKYLDYLLSKNDFVVKNKLRVNLFLLIFLFSIFALSFLF